MKAGTPTRGRTRGLGAVAVSAALIALVAVALLATAASARTAPAATWRPCGADFHREAGWYGVIQRDTTCTQARRLARRWWHANPTWGFDCTVLPKGHDTGRVLCRRDRGDAVEQVRFSYSSSA